MARFWSGVWLAAGGLETLYADTRLNGSSPLSGIWHHAVHVVAFAVRPEGLLGFSEGLWDAKSAG